MTREEAHRILDAVLDLNATGGKFKVMLEINRYDFSNEQFASLFVFDSANDELKVVDMCNVQEGASTAEDALNIIKKWRAENETV